MSVTFESHADDILHRAKTAREKALWAIGAAAEGHAKDVITQEGRVDTGRMRNSVNHAEKDDATYIGTNVDYAIYNEMGTVRMRGIHFLQRAATEHTEEYRELAKQAYEAG